MDAYDYKFIFEDMVDGYSSVSLYKSDQSSPNNFVIDIDDFPIHLLKGKRLSSIQADLLDLAIAIHFTDKLAIPKKKRSIDIHIYLPLRCPDIFTQAGPKLHDLLFWYTKDYWHFHFRQREAGKRMSERLSVGYLSLYDLPEFTEFALWSGGLDSLAGLQTRLLESSDKHFVLVGTGSNNIMRKTQHRVFWTLNALPHASGRLHLLHIPIKVEYEARYIQNQTHRARGVVFLLVGAVCALANGVNKLSVYETGIGAINLHLPGGVGRDHTKAVHPISLIDMGDFISGIVGSNFTFENPFLFSTKAEMCSSLKEFSLPIIETISCDRLHREKYIQCGFCSSCILRRQALTAAGIKDKSKYLVPNGRKPESRHYAYWNKMNQQIHIIDQALSAPNAWFELCLEYPDDLPDIVNRIAQKEGYVESVIKENLIQLYKTYVREWESVANLIHNALTDATDSTLEDERWQQMYLIK